MIFFFMQIKDFVFEIYNRYTHLIKHKQLKETLLNPVISKPACIFNKGFTVMYSSN